MAMPIVLNRTWDTMPDEATLQAAREKLADHGGYNWLLEGRSFWTPAQVMGDLESEGMPVSNDTVVRWFRSLEHTQDFGGRGGIRASKNDLILFFASRMTQ